MGFLGAVHSELVKVKHIYVCLLLGHCCLLFTMSYMEAQRITKS